MHDWQEVFDCYPDADHLFVVDGMLFTERGHADSHARSTGKPVEVVARPVSVSEEEDGSEQPEAVKPKGKGNGKK